MKKQLLIAVCIIMMSISASAATINKALLEHNGEVTLYDGDKIQDAVNAASDGDVIYLTLGTFKPFNVTRKITIRGAGDTSIIDGDVTISIPGASKLTSPVLESLAVSGTVHVGAQVDDLIIRKCKIANFTIGAQIDGAVLDRCYITSALTLSSYIIGMTVVNTKLYTVNANSGATQNTTFVNCNIYALSTNNFSATIMNSIIQSVSNSSYSSSTLNSTVVLNSLINKYSSSSSYPFTLGSSSVTQGCYIVSEQNVVTSVCECKYDTYTLQSKAYLGTDGNVVGIYGGDTPYTLDPSVPQVTSSDIKLDTKTKKLNVKLTVSPQ
jgi:hypothetical protein